MEDRISSVPESGSRHQSPRPRALYARLRYSFATGSQYMLFEHLAHPEGVIDVRAQTSAPSSKLAARQLLTAAGVPDAHVLWLLEHWWA